MAAVVSNFKSHPHGVSHGGTHPLRDSLVMRETLLVSELSLSASFTFRELLDTVCVSLMLMEWSSDAKHLGSETESLETAQPSKHRIVRCIEKLPGCLSVENLQLGWLSVSSGVGFNDARVKPTLNQNATFRVACLPQPVARPTT